MIVDKRKQHRRVEAGTIRVNAAEESPTTWVNVKRSPTRPRPAPASLKPRRTPRRRVGVHSRSDEDRQNDFAAEGAHATEIAMRIWTIWSGIVQIHITSPSKRGASFAMFNRTRHLPSSFPMITPIE